MKPIAYYSEVKAPYPNKRDLTTTFWYKAGAVYAKKEPGQDRPVIVSTGALAGENELRGLPKDSVTDEDTYKRLVQAYGAENGRLHAEFKDDALDYVGLGKDSARDVIYAKAYEDGHAHGFGEVLNKLESLATFVNNVDNARTDARLAKS